MEGTKVTVGTGMIKTTNMAKGLRRKTRGILILRRLMRLLEIKRV
jgi:hypothetical protein